MANEHNKLTGIPALAYRGVEASSPLQLIYHTRNPKTNDKKNYPIGCWWINTVNNTVWSLVSLENNTATWLQFDTSIGDLLEAITSTGTSVPDGTRTLYFPNGTLVETANGGLNTIDFNIPDGGDGQVIIGQGAVAPVWGDLTSQAASVTITPDLTGPGTVNLDVTAFVTPTTFHTDAGNAIVAADILNVIGAHGIQTAGAGNTITLGLSNPPAPLTVHTDAGNATVAADILNVFGGQYIDTAGAGNTVTVTLGAINGRSINDCSFMAYLNAPIPNHAGGVNIYPIPANTELFDTGNDYNNATYTFVAPRNGYYHFIFGVLYTHVPARASNTIGPIAYFSAQINGVFPANYFTRNWSPNQAFVITTPDYGGASLSSAGTFILPLSAGDTLQIMYYFGINNPGHAPWQPDVITIYGAPLPGIYTYFGGYQIY